MFNKFIELIKSPVKFRLFLFTKLPAAFFSGVRVKFADEEKCIAIVPYKWFSTNPFGSTYFACLAMAAELSTGVLAMGHSFKQTPAVSMLVVKIEGNFFKKATGITSFICRDGLKIKEAIQQAIASGSGIPLTALAEGENKDGEIVASFFVTWSFKAKQAA